MSFKKLVYGSNYFFTVLIALGILGLINFLNHSAFMRWDLTEQQLFTISEPTRKILKNLDDVVSIKVYFSQDLPPYLIPIQQQVKDILDEYMAYAGNKLSVEFTDPAQSPSLERQVQQMGIPRIQLNIIEKDQAQVRTAYLGIGFFYEEKKEAIPIVEDISTLEYELTAAIKRVTADETKSVGLFFPGEREKWESKYRFVQLSLEKEYQLKTVSDLDKQGVPPEINTLLVPSTGEISERTKYEIDQFLMRGGKLFFLLDAVSLKPNSIEASPLESKLDDLLTHYGVRLKKELVLDKVNARASFNQGFMSFSLPYPYWVKVPKRGFASHPALKRLDGLVLPWTSPLENIQSEGIETTVLASSSPYSWAQTTNGFINLSPQQRFRPPAKLQSYPLAVLLNGEFTSFYAGKEIPPVPDRAETEKTTKQNEPLSAEATAKDEKPLTKSPASQIIVIGNSRFLEDNFLRMFRSNGLFFLNLMDWLNVGDELIQIRARQIDERPLQEISEEKKSYLRFFNTFGISVLVVAIGLARFYYKRQAQQKYEQSTPVQSST